MPSVGAIGGIKRATTSAAQNEPVVNKRRLENGQVSNKKHQKVSAEEAAAIARREAARARVQSRTMQAFGLG